MNQLLAKADFQFIIVFVLIRGFIILNSILISYLCAVIK